MENDLYAEYKNRSKIEFVVELVIMIMVTVAALLGNIMVCLAVFRNKTLRTTPNIYVVTLALSDILMASLCMPLSLNTLLYSTWTKSYDVCQFQGFFTFFFAFTSLQTMTAMAINRYYRIVKPVMYKNIFTVKRTCASVIIVVVSSAFGAGLHLVSGWAIYKFHYGKVICFSDYKTQEMETGYIAFLDIFYISLPVLVISICYFNIFKTVRNHKKNLFATKRIEPNTNQKNPPKSTMNVEEIRITKALFVTVLGFIICWSPIAIIDLIDASHTIQLPRKVYLMYIYLGFGSSSINPFIYGILNRSFRREFMRMFTLKCRNQIENSETGNSITLPPQTAHNIIVISLEPCTTKSN